MTRNITLVKGRCDYMFLGFGDRQKPKEMLYFFPFSIVRCFYGVMLFFLCHFNVYKAFKAQF